MTFCIYVNIPNLNIPLFMHFTKTFYKLCKYTNKKIISTLLLFPLNIKYFIYKRGKIKYFNDHLKRFINFNNVSCCCLRIHRYILLIFNCKRTRSCASNIDI